MDADQAGIAASPDSARSESELTRQAGAVTPVDFSAPVFTQIADVSGTMFLGALAGVLALLVAEALGLRRPLAILLIFVPITFVVALAYQAWRRATALRRGRVAMLALRQLGPAVILRRVCEAAPGCGATAGMISAEFAHAAAMEGFGGATLMPATAMPPDVQPMRVAFFPQPLDEVRSDTIEHTATGLQGESRFWSTARNLGLSPALRRFLKLHGMRLVLIGVGATVAADVAFKRSISLGEITLLLGILVVALFLREPTRGRAWYVIPGGLVLRSTRWLRLSATTHHFDRPRSVLCLVPETQSRSRWLVSVGDAHDSAFTHATLAETEFLLRAWLSPIPPPNEEQLAVLR